METWSTPLIVAIAAFLALLLWRIRPRMGWTAPGRIAGKEIREAQARVEAAKTEPERAMALCDAADLMRGGGAKATYLRAMRADLTARLILNQPQYQTSEVLIGVIALGSRALERPATMRRRQAGETKKGHNVLYGMRFARVILVTWWRERKSLALHLKGTS